MTEIGFVDTNVLVYARDPRDPQKQRLAANLLAQLWQLRSGRSSIQC
jgi:predicted nucleic acid-binding protein